MTLDRTVFSTDVAIDTINPNWVASGAIEIGIQVSAGAVSQQAILYRSPGGDIRDISDTVTITIVGSSFKLAKPIEPLDSNLIAVQKIGFEITVNDLSLTTATFNGSFCTYDATNAQTNSLWRGSYVCVTNVSLAIIHAAQQPLSQQFLDFMNITPFDSANNNEVQVWADALFTEMCLHSLPSWAINDFYGGNLGDLGSRFVANNLKAPLPSYLGSNPGNYLNLTNILQDNNELFYMSAMHLMVRSLLNAQGWYYDNDRTACQDKVVPFFNLISCPTTADPTTIQNLKNAYGANLTAALDFNVLSSQYQDACQRCYYAAYVCFQPSWSTYLADPGTSYQTLKTTLVSQQYQQHWLPTLIPLTDTPGSVPIDTTLQILSDKLQLLAIMEEKSTGQTGDVADAASVVTTLSTAALGTGLVRTTFITPDSKDITLNIPTVYVDTNDTNWTPMFMPGGETTMEIPGMGAMVASADLREHLKNDAGPLGLYDWSAPSAAQALSNCVIM